MASFVWKCLRISRFTHLYRLRSSVAQEAELISSVAASSKRWQLLSAVCLERPPVLTAPMNSIETDMSELLSQIEMENSSLCDHELRHLDDLKHAEKRKQEEYEETDADIVLQTAVEAEDLWEEELNSFNAAKRTTAFDDASDIRSVQRKLDHKLVLLVKQKLGSGETWCLPMGVHTEGETMRKAAERALEGTCGSGLKALFLGNAPCGFYKYRYPAPARKETGCIGAKVFFFKAQLQDGSITPSSVVSDHAWVTYSELPKYTPSAYYKRICQFVLEM